MGLCDPVPLARVADLMAGVEPSKQFTTLHAAWRDYVATAARPYGWPTFRLHARSHLIKENLWSKHVAQQPLQPWQTDEPARPSIIALEHFASLRVRRGALEIEHGDRNSPALTRIEVDAPKPSAILFETHAEFLTGDAMRFCSRHSIALILPGGPGRPPMTVTDVCGETRNKKYASHVPDADPSIALAQVRCAIDRAKTAAVAREIVRAKIEAAASAISFSPQDCEAVAQWSARLPGATTLTQILTVEARATAAYWRTFRDQGLRERKGGDLPRLWLRFANRNRRGAAFRADGVRGSPRNATHGLNAMLNYCYVVEAGRLARALAARGAMLQVGFLHSPKTGRASLVWDALEPLRPVIDTKVFAFVAAREFARADFPSGGLRTVRLSRPLASALLHHCSLSARQVGDATDWMVALIEEADQARLLSVARTKSDTEASGPRAAAASATARRWRPWADRLMD